MIRVQIFNTRRPYGEIGDTDRREDYMTKEVGHRKWVFPSRSVRLLGIDASMLLEVERGYPSTDNTGTKKGARAQELPHGQER